MLSFTCWRTHGQTHPKVLQDDIHVEMHLPAQTRCKKERTYLEVLEDDAPVIMHLPADTWCKKQQAHLEILEVNAQAVIYLLADTCYRDFESDALQAHTGEVSQDPKTWEPIVTWPTTTPTSTSEVCSMETLMQDGCGKTLAQGSTHLEVLKDDAHVVIHLLPDALEHERPQLVLQQLRIMALGQVGPLIPLLPLVHIHPHRVLQRVDEGPAHLGLLLWWLCNAHQ